MSGHSKWHTIRHKKAILDSKRGKVFTKLGKEIMVASRLSGSDPKINSRLRLAIEKAKSANMPLTNIEKAIKKGAGKLDNLNYQDMLYEGYGPYQVATLVSVLTDNKNRTVSELRMLFQKNGGTLGGSGTVSWMFEKYFKTILERKNQTESEILEYLLDYNIAEIIFQEKEILIYGNINELEEIKSFLLKKNQIIKSSELLYLPKNSLQLDEKQLDTVAHFIDTLEDHIDVQNVYTSLDSF